MLVCGTVLFHSCGVDDDDESEKKVFVFIPIFLLLFYIHIYANILELIPYGIKESNFTAHC